MLRRLARRLVETFERIPRRTRRSIQIGLAFFVVVVGSLAWSWNYWIQNQTDGLTRYIRVDSWSAFQTLVLYSELKGDMVPANIQEPDSRELLSRKLAQARSSLELLLARNNRDQLQGISLANDWVGEASALRRLEKMLAAARTGTVEAASNGGSLNVDQPTTSGDGNVDLSNVETLSGFANQERQFNPNTQVRNRMAQAPGFVLEENGLGAQTGLDRQVDGELAALFEDAKSELLALISELKNAASDLAIVRFELQDQDLDKARWLIASNRFVLVSFFLFAGALGLVLIAEALIARSAQSRAVRSERRFRDISQVASDSIWETDANGMLTYASDQETHPLNFAFQKQIGRSLTQMARADMRQSGLRLMLLAIREGREFRDLLIDVDAGGNEEEIRTVRFSGRPVLDSDNELVGYRGVASDISAEVQREERIRYLAENDFLTKLPNRHKFHEIMADQVLTIDKDQELISLFLIDLDGFKEINDTSGHLIGDQLLVRAADRILKHLDENLTLARLGGDEFAVLGKIKKSAKHAISATAERIVGALAQPFDIKGNRLVIGASAGISFYPEDVSERQDLLQSADLALHAAKKLPHLNVLRYQSDMALEIQKRREIEDDLRKALRNGELDLHFQPQICLKSGKLIGAEALVRWEHPTLGRINPELFVSIAEERGMISQLGRWVLETACKEAMQWPGGIVAVNVSPAQFIHDDLVSLTRDVLASTGLPSSRLELEITEGVLLKNEEEAVAVLRQFTEMGIQLAIDDFGTGYSSLSYLKRLPVDKVKIDRSFVMDLDRDQDDQMIVKAILSLAQALGLKTIAEGIELQDHVSILERMGCDEGQGYHFGKPLPRPEFLQFASDMMGENTSQSASSALLPS